MRTFLIGCGSVALICVLCVCGGVGYVSWWGNSFIANLETGIETVAENYKANVKDYPFDRPESPEFEAERFEIMIEARQTLADTLEQTSAYQLLTNPEQLGFFNLMGELRRLGTTLVEISDPLFEKLNEKQMSVVEYQYYIEAYMATLIIESKKQNTQLSEEMQAKVDEVREMESNLNNSNSSGDFNLNINFTEMERYWSQADEAEYEELLAAVKGTESKYDSFKSAIGIDMILFALTSEARRQQEQNEDGGETEQPLDSQS